MIDLSKDTHRQIIIDRESGQYLGHPSTVLLENKRTMFCVYPTMHGRGSLILKKSVDGGLTWSDRLSTPHNWQTSLETPIFYRTVDPITANRRIIMWSGRYPIRLAISEDDGKTWSPLRKLWDRGGLVAMSTCIQLKNGEYLAMFHDDGRYFLNRKIRDKFIIYTTRSKDGGVNWILPKKVCEHGKAKLCEPEIIRSPDGNQLACIFREQSKKFNSFLMFSDNEGQTWSSLKEMSHTQLTGDRHQHIYNSKGELFISFRDTVKNSPSYCHWVAWVGSYNDLVNGTEGKYKIKLMHNYKWSDCAYPSLEINGDNTIIATTYGHWTKGQRPYIVSVRLNLNEFEN